MKAVVLSGGGSKGAYQLGVWKALKKINYDYKIITGTSVGALNGALMTQKTFYKSLLVWNKINFTTLFGKTNTTSDKLLDLYKIYGKNFIQQGGMDTTNLEKLIKKNINIKKFLSSDINYGLVTYNISKNKAIEFQKKEITKDKLVDYLIASATCYPAFQKKEIDGSKYIDGGFYDNLPINLAIKMGATEIIAVDLKAPGIKRKTKDKTIPIINITPNNKLSNFLSFTKAGTKRNIKLGYNDTMKKFSKFEGKKYTFKKGHIEKNKQAIKEIYMYTLKKIIPDTKILLKYKDLATFFNINNSKLKDEIFLKVIEKTAQDYHIDETKIYTYKKFNKELKKAIKKQLQDKKFQKSTEYNILKYIRTDEIKELKKTALTHPIELLKAIYIFALFEA